MEKKILNVIQDIFKIHLIYAISHNSLEILRIHVIIQECNY